MTCRDYKDLMMGYLDDELDTPDRDRFKEHLAGCDDCKKELKEFEDLKRITDDVDLCQPEDKLWEQYWQNIYNRTERSVGWIVFSLAAMLLLVYGGFKFIEEVIKDPTVGLVCKVGLIGLIVGTAILLVSIARERLYIRKRDRYKDVRR
jgi:predicted anti-sigma-YlaC factor YlaD